ncbi:glycosyltransferase [Geodermatophilus sp. SYSU D01036]
MTFHPVRVLAVDLASGEVEYPDPEVRPTHATARVLVRWLGEPLGILDVDGPDEEVARATAESAWRALRPQLVAAAARRGRPAPRSVEDLTIPGADGPVPTRSTAGASPLVTVSVASFRNVGPTVECVRRILTSSWSPLEVVVVDNDADPAALGRALEEHFAGDARVRWVHEPRQGLSFARNAGLAAARGSIVVFTDDDVLVDHHWVERLVAGFESTVPVACVTGAILPAEIETRAQLWLEEYGGFHKGFERRVFDATPHRDASPLYPFNAGQFGSGANMAFRADVLREIGGFAVDLGAGTLAHGGEDLDISLRTILAGHTIVYEPAALMWHRHRRSYEALRRQMFRYGIGLAAAVTKWCLDDPWTAWEVLRRVPRGVLLLLRPTSDKNKRKSESFPAVLSVLELLGVLVGPVAYLRSRRHTRRVLATSRTHTIPRSSPGDAVGDTTPTDTAGARAAAS